MATTRRILLMFMLALFGLAVSGYLTAGYLAMADLACTDTGCDIIRNWHDKNFPVRGFLPILGVAYFLALTVLTYMLGSANAKNGRNLAMAAVTLGGAGTAAVAVFTAIEVSLQAYCFWCLLVAGATLAYFILSVMEWRAWGQGRGGYEMDFEPFLKWGWVPFVLVALMVSAMDKSDARFAATPADSGNTANAPVINTAAGNTPATNPAGANSLPATDPAEVMKNQILANMSKVDMVPAGAHIKGPEKAPITLVEFADPGCGACANQSPILDELLKKYPNDLRLVYRHFPLKSHPNSPLAAEAMEAAGAQGKFWEMRDVIFRNIGAQTEPDLIRYAGQVGLNVDQFTKDLKSRKYASRVQRDRSAGDQLGINRTPTMILNGKKIFSGPMPLPILDTAVKAQLESPQGTPAS
ncbi:MAG: thioredoxin domain-containing protein [Armatimonadetes bacterium]|nr:thioredoxin domain-containing protein [Armatimonadota bacterium]